MTDGTPRAPFTTEELVRTIAQVVEETPGFEPAFTCLFGSAARDMVPVTVRDRAGDNRK